MRRLKEAITLACHIHEHQVDKGGQPYILHPLRVMCALQKASPSISETVLIAAVLHDIIEDDEYGDHHELIYFEKRVQELVVMLTRGLEQKNESYVDYIKRLSKDPDASLIKCYDLLDNMDLSRIPSPTDEDYRRLEKYKKAFLYLSTTQELG